MRVIKYLGEVKMKELYCKNMEELMENWDNIPEKSWFKRSNTLLNEWDFEKNSDINLLKIKFKEKYWLQCKKCGSSYDKTLDTVSALVKKNGIDAELCNYCVGKSVNHTNSVFATHPKTKEYWSKNNTVDPHSLRFSSRTKVLWNCHTCDTEFENSVDLFVRAMDSQFKGCPYCAGKRVNKTNSVLNQYPELLEEWDATNNKYKLTEVTAKSDKRINWICKQNHTWTTSVKDRVKNSVDGKSISQCPYCANYKVWKGYNDIPTLYPELVSKIVHEDDLYKWNHGSANKIEWKCDKCNTNLGFKSVKNVTKHGLTCAICSETVPATERLMAIILKQLNIKFDHNQGYTWSQNKMYDFFLPEFNTMIELHGEHHYVERDNIIFHKTRSLKEEKYNDKLKREIALENGIANYIEIPCLKTDFDSLKEVFTQNKPLNNLLPLNKVDWKLAFEQFKIN